MPLKPDLMSDNEVVYHSRDAINATESIVERGFFYLLHDDSPYGLVLSSGSKCMGSLAAYQVTGVMLLNAATSQLKRTNRTTSRCPLKTLLQIWAHKYQHLAHHSVCIRLAVSRTTVSARRALCQWAGHSGFPANDFRLAYRAHRLRGNCALPSCHQGT